MTTLPQLRPLSAGEALSAQVRDLKVDVRLDSGVCDSGVELSTA